MLTPREFYRDNDVRRNMAQYLGGNSDVIINGGSFWESFLMAEYVVGYGKALQDNFHKEFKSMEPQDLEWILENGLDAFRSVQSRNSIMCVFDVETFDNSNPKEVLLKSREAFERLEPVYWTIEGIYNELGIDHISVMTGKGYHFVCRVPFESRTFSELAEIGHVEDSLRGKYRHIEGSRRKRAVNDPEGRAYNAVGKLLEFISFIVISRARDISPEEITISDPKPRGISLDTTQYGDPLHMRDFRIVFSTHQKAMVEWWKYGREFANFPYLISLPRHVRIYKSDELHQESLHNLFQMRTHFENSARYASYVNSEIPDASYGISNLVSAYRNSWLYGFHRDFDSTRQEEWHDWHKTYDRTDISLFSRDVADAIRYPNPLLLKPGRLQKVTVELMGRGWHPKHIAGLIRSRYEKSEFSWGEDWTKYDANTRANWWTRVYSAMHELGLD